MTGGRTYNEQIHLEKRRSRLHKSSVIITLKKVKSRMHGIWRLAMKSLPLLVTLCELDCQNTLWVVIANVSTVLQTAKLIVLSYIHCNQSEKVNVLIGWSGH